MTALAPDPRIPARDRLLDAEEMAPRIASALRRSALGGVRLRAKYRVGESLRVLFWLCGGDGDGLLVACRAPFHRTAGSRIGRRAPAFFDEELDAGFWCFPEDRKIGGLPCLRTPDRSPLLAEFGVTRTELVGWTPEKLATAACRDAERRLVGFAKVFGDSLAERSRLRHRLAGQLGLDALRLPRLLGADRPRRLLLIEPLPGRPLASPGAPEAAADFGVLGRGLAALHAVPAPPGIPRFARLGRGRIETAASILRRARPDLTGPVGALVAALRARPVPRHASGSLLHGDLHAGNARVAGEAAGLLDLDQLASGPPALELGSLLGALHCIELTAGTRTDAAREALLRGYAEDRGLPPRQELAWATAAALLCERALRAVGRVRPAELRVLPALLARARAVLHGEGGVA